LVENAENGFALVWILLPDEKQNVYTLFLHEPLVFVAQTLLAQVEKYLSLHNLVFDLMAVSKQPQKVEDQMDLGRLLQMVHNDLHEIHIHFVVGKQNVCN